MRILRLALALLLPLSLLAACGDDDDDVAVGDDDTATTVTTAPDESSDVTEASTTLTFGIDDDGSTQQLSVGEAFDVVLEQCIGCGYSWQLQTNDEPGAFGEDDTVTMLGEEDIRRGPSEDADGNPIVGGMADHVVHFRANQAGSVNVDLAYIGPGRTEPDSADDELIISIEVS